MYFRRDSVEQAIGLFGDYSKIIRLQATAEGLGDCDAWVDSKESPHLGAIRYESKVYVAGRISDEKDARLLKDFLRVAVAGQKLEGHALDKIQIRTFDYELGEALPRFLRGCKLENRKREYLEISLPADGTAFKLAEGYCLRDVDEELIMDGDIGDIDLLRGECAYRHDSMGLKGTDYLGLVAMKGNDIAGWCLSEYTCSVGCEIGIEVLEAHQHRGIAKAMTCRFLERAHEKGLKRIGWHCYQDNIASFRTATACGFKPVLTYGEIDIEFPPTHLGAAPGGGA
ncbi:MAG: Acetyltransferase (GNAT) family protein [Firmicutes bacterium ADurb.Bin153]|nr:MAG: Acetyltransferase (GNAT) family protein [Firmicutes bacterium ADurb.Bin153]